MILVDTSIWIDHIRRSNQRLVELLDRNEIVRHPYVVGEIALGSLRNRYQMLADLRRLPSVVLASDDEVMTTVERRRLYGRGVDFVDAHLVVSTILTPNCQLWARDRRLHALAVDLGIAANLPAH